MAHTNSVANHENVSFPQPNHIIDVEEVYPSKSHAEIYKDMSFSTKAIHCGMDPDPTTGAVNPPIYMSSTFHMKNPSTHKGYMYSRVGNPGYKSPEMQLAALEGGEYALVFSSGIASIASIALNCSPGDHVLCFESCYAGTYGLLTKILSQFHVQAHFFDGGDYEQLIQNLKDFKPKILFFESPSNPLLDCVDIKKVAQICKEHDCITAFDNTFSTPYHLNPLSFGVDIVMHSSTKFLGGHSDMLSGAIVTNSKELYEKCLYYRRFIGLMPSPFESWLLARSIKSLKVRVHQHSQNALKFAEHFSTHPMVTKVYYPGLPQHKDYALAVKQMKNGFGGMMSIDLNFSGIDQMYKFIENLKIFTLGISLGGAESLINHSVTMTHASIPDQLKSKLGLTQTFLRVSIGLEDVDDLINDFEQAFTKSS